MCGGSCSLGAGCEIRRVSAALHLDGLLGQHLLPQVLQSISAVGFAGIRMWHRRNESTSRRSSASSWNRRTLAAWQLSWDGGWWKRRSASAGNPQLPKQPPSPPKAETIFEASTGCQREVRPGGNHCTRFVMFLLMYID